MIWNVWTSRRQDAQLLGIVNERDYRHAVEAAAATFSTAHIVEPCWTEGGPFFGRRIDYSGYTNYDLDGNRR